MDCSRGATYWMELAAYDLDVAKAMLSTGKYLYVGFMCHQVIEKALKGCYTFVKQEMPPYKHNLIFLAQSANIYETFSEDQKNTIRSLMPLNVEARYPADREKLLQSLNETRCREIIKETEELFVWIKTKLSQN